jgi:Asp-tRNA(Asn)/Glu-tRNA(Gln) amidotransferase A subunit family amidase
MITHIETKLEPLAAALRQGELELKDYLKQLETEFDAENDRIQAFLPEEGRFERLLREAAALEARYPEPESRPPLFGVPVGVKDIFHADGFPTRAGSRLPAELLAGPEAESVTLLKQAGALILGKTVTTEFAYFGPGPTRNPHNPEHTPGGSSSGSAAAVAAGLCPLALGTQTIGSIIRPASFCGAVGFKPSYGRISAKGVIPISISLDHVGFFAQDVAGIKLTAAQLCHDWQAELASAEKPVLGIPTGPYLQKASAEGLDHFQTVIQKLEEADFLVQAVEVLEEFDEIVAWHNDLMAGEMAQVHRDWFEQYKELYHPKTAALIERGHQVPASSLRVYAAARERLRDELEDLMAEYRLSLWIAPAAAGTAPHGLESTGDPIMNLPWTNAGLPAISLPSGFGHNGLPLGIQLIGRWQDDEKLLGWAEQVAAVLASGD